MDEFTFAIISYKQEKMILELLNSIKYQIVYYGENISVDLVVADDASPDNTQYIASRWIDDNKTLFRNITKIFEKENHGVVSNFKSAMANVKTEKFKLIAGDDVFSNENVFKCLDNTDEDSIVSFIPTTLCDGVISLRKDWFVKHIRFAKKKRDNKYDLMHQEYGSYFHTPTVFYNKKLFDEFYEAPSVELKLFEDDPLWHSILKNNKKSHVVFQDRYLVLYRMHNESICQSAESPYAKAIQAELRQYKKSIVDSDSNWRVKAELLLQMNRPKCKYLDIIRYRGKLEIWMRTFMCNTLPKYKDRYQKLLNQIENTQQYYNYIIEEAESQYFRYQEDI